MVESEMASGPCGACKFLRRKCAAGCVFAPHFASEQGPARFAAIHKVFGASNASKMLSHLPLPDRFHAVPTIAFEAQARIRNPVHGCVAHIFALQHQVMHLQDELARLGAQLAAHQSAVAAEFGASQHFATTMEDYCVDVGDYSSSIDNGISFRDDEVALLRRESKRRRRHDFTDLQQMALMMTINNGN